MNLLFLLVGAGGGTEPQAHSGQREVQVHALL